MTTLIEKLPTIKMQPWKAREKFVEYRKAVRERHQGVLAKTKAKSGSVGLKRLTSRLANEDKLLMEVYRSLARGNTVLNVAEVMRTTGVDFGGRPRLAIAKAIWHRVEFTTDRWSSNRDLRHRPTFHSCGSGDHTSNPPIILPRGTFPYHAGGVQCQAAVPQIPPPQRPAKLDNKYYILWDVEWDRAPDDPILLRHIKEHFYAVVSYWNLSPVEKCLLGLQ